MSSKFEVCISNDKRNIITSSNEKKEAQLIRYHTAIYEEKFLFRMIDSVFQKSLASTILICLEKGK